MCGGIFDDDVEWDHVNPLQQTCARQPTKWQAICASCHLEKTALEGKQDRTLESTFSLPTWRAYVETPRPPPFVFWAHDWGEGEDALELDVRRCRRNALMYSAHDFAIFSPFDGVLPAEAGRLADFSWVELRQRASANTMPYYGPGWYHRAAVEFMLHHGRCTWQDLTWSLEATAHIPATCLAEPLRVMEEAWGDQSDLAKDSVNQMIGLWAKDETHVYHVKTSCDPCDGLGAWARRYVAFEGGCINDYVFATPLLSNRSMRPIHDQIMATEHTRLAQLLFCVKALKVPPRCLKCVKTDCLVLKDFPRKRKRELEEISTLTFAELPRLRARAEGAAGAANWLDSYATMAGSQSSDEVFRLGPGEPLQCVPSKPWRAPAKSCQHSFDVTKIWKDLSKEEALQLMLDGEGLLIVGAPGTGKTHWLRNAVATLRQEGKRVDIVAKTHAAVQNINSGAHGRPLGQEARKSWRGALPHPGGRGAHAGQRAALG
jgi:hypothetical protein